jgi:hypothetical protein
MKKQVGAMLVSLFVVSAPAAVRVYVEEHNALAWIQYECTAGEIVRAFALDVSVDHGSILDISDFFRGPSTESAQGYGIFPASLRDHIIISPGTNIDWNISGYTPLANPADNTGSTLPGLNSSGVTLEFGALWDPNVPTAVPPPTGTLCALRISERATVSVTGNSARGGVLATEPDVLLLTVFEEAIVQPPQITSLSLTNGLLTVTYAGGELETAPSLTGPWTGTTETNGVYTESASDETNKFYRVRGP